MQRASSDRAELWYLRGRKIKEKKQITFKHAKQCTLRAIHFGETCNYVNRFVSTCVPHVSKLILPCDIFPQLPIVQKARTGPFMCTRQLINVLIALLAIYTKSHTLL